jgi:hypothetical protein
MLRAGARATTAEIDAERFGRAFGDWRVSG